MADPYAPDPVDEQEGKSFTDIVPEEEDTTGADYSDDGSGDSSDEDEYSEPHDLSSEHKADVISDGVDDGDTVDSGSSSGDSSSSDDDSTDFEAPAAYGPEAGNPDDTNDDGRIDQSESSSSGGTSEPPDLTNEQKADVISDGVDDGDTAPEPTSMDRIERAKKRVDSSFPNAQKVSATGAGDGKVDVRAVGPDGNVYTGTFFGEGKNELRRQFQFGEDPYRREDLRKELERSREGKESRYSPLADKDPFRRRDLQREAERAREGKASLFNPEEETLEQVAQTKLEQQLEQRTGRDLTPGEDFVVEREGTGFRAQLTPSAQRDIAMDQLESDLEAETGTDLVPGEDFTVERTSSGYRAALTESGKQTVQQQRREELDLQDLQEPYTPRQAVFPEDQSVLSGLLDYGQRARSREKKDLEILRQVAAEGVEGAYSTLTANPVARTLTAPARTFGGAVGNAASSPEANLVGRALTATGRGVAGAAGKSMSTVGDVQLTGKATEPNPTEGSGPTLEETPRAAVNAAQEGADAAQPLSQIRLYGSASEPSPLRGSGPTLEETPRAAVNAAQEGADAAPPRTVARALTAPGRATANAATVSGGLTREQLAATAAAGVVAPEPVSTGTGLLIGGGLLAAGYFASENGEIPVSPTERQELQPSDEEGRRVEIDISPGETVSPSELGLPEDAFRETPEGEIPASVTDGQAVINDDGEIELPAETTAVAKQKRYEDEEEEVDDEEKNDGGENDEQEEETVVVEVPEEMIPDEEVTIGGEEEASQEEAGDQAEDDADEVLQPFEREYAGSDSATPEETVSDEDFWGEQGQEDAIVSNGMGWTGDVAGGVFGGVAAGVAASGGLIPGARERQQAAQAPEVRARTRADQQALQLLQQPILNETVEETATHEAEETAQETQQTTAEETYNDVGFSQGWDFNLRKRSRQEDEQSQERQATSRSEGSTRPGSGEFASGWFNEFVTAYAIGPGPREAPSQEQLADFGGAAALSEQLPTETQLTADEETEQALEAAEDLFGFGEIEVFDDGEGLL